MSVVLAVIGVIVIATVSGITLWWSAIVSAIRISYALRDIPRHHKEHWLFGNLPFVVSHSFVHILSELHGHPLYVLGKSICR